MYKVGDKVVYPHHGAGTVVKRESREILGQKREYLTIQILHNDMTVNVPAENAEKVGAVINCSRELIAFLSDAIRLEYARNLIGGGEHTLALDLLNDCTGAASAAPPLRVAAQRGPHQAHGPRTGHQIPPSSSRSRPALVTRSMESRWARSATAPAAGMR